MKNKTQTLGQRAAIILRHLGIKPEGMSYRETARIIDRCASRN